MTDEKKIKDEELANMTGAGGTDLDLNKKPAGGGGGAEIPEGEAGTGTLPDDLNTN